MMKRMATVVVALAVLVAGCTTSPTRPGETALDPRPSVPEGTQNSGSGTEPAQTTPEEPKPNEQGSGQNPSPQPSEPEPTNPNCPAPKSTYTEVEAEACVKVRATAAIGALKAKDMKKLASLVHPKKGVQFGLEGRVQNSPAFSAAQVEQLFSDTTEYLWGYVGGKPTEVRSTFAGLYQSTIYHQDFANAPVVVYGRIYRSGNGNVTVPSGQIVVEYHFPGFDPKYGGMDWTSLRLYFERSGGQWYLVSVIEDNWQI